MKDRNIAIEEVKQFMNNKKKYSNASMPMYDDESYEKHFNYKLYENNHNSIYDKVFTEGETLLEYLIQ